jgi:NAD(P)H-flavin reductase
VPTAVRVLAVARETHDTVTLTLELPPGYTHEHGQFNMLSLPGIGDVPISIAGSNADTLEHTLRSVGKATAALSELRAGSYLGLRGPFGTSWPLAAAVGHEVVVIAGGIGLAPLRSTLREVIGRPADFPRVRLLYGTRAPRDILYNRELLGWGQSARVRVHVTVDRADDTWNGNIGVVTKLIRRKRMPKDGVFLLCGPEVMMSFALAELLAMEVPPENIYLSMERNMKCAVGLCGRCQYGPHFVCKDGPVFRYDTISDIFGKRGF